MTTIQQLDVAMLRLKVEIELRGLPASSPAFQQMKNWWNMMEATIAEESAKVSVAQAMHPYMDWQ